MRPLILKGHTRPLTCVKYNADGDLLFSASKDSSPTVWFTDTGERLGTFTNNGHRGAVWSIDVDKRSEYVITGGADAYIKVWKVRTGECIKTFYASGPVRVVEWAEGSDLDSSTIGATGEGSESMFLCSSDPFNKTPCTMRIYRFDGQAFRNSSDSAGQAEEGSDADAGAISEESPLFSWQIAEFSVSDKITVGSWTSLNEYIITGDVQGNLRIHLPSTGEIISKIRAHNGKINTLSWNKNKNLLITGGTDCQAYLFSYNRTGEKKENAQEERKENEVEGLSDGGMLERLKSYVSNTPVNAASISPIKEHVLIAGGQEAMEVTTTSSRVGKFETKFFHLVFEEEWGSVKGHFGPVNTLAIHPDGTGFSSGSEDGYIRVHNFDKEYFSMHSEFDDINALEQLAQQASAMSLANSTTT